jgi:hypothetical protein
MMLVHVLAETQELDRSLPPVTVPGGVDGRDRETAGGDIAVGAYGQAGFLLVLAAAVAEQNQRAVARRSGGCPEHAGDVAEGEQSFRDAVRRRL